MGPTVTQAARKLTVSPETLLELINERAGISMEMARRLAEAFGLTAETRLALCLPGSCPAAPNRTVRRRLERG